MGNRLYRRIGKPYESLLDTFGNNGRRHKDPGRQAFCERISLFPICAQHAVAGDLAFALRAAAKRLNRHVGPPAHGSIINTQMKPTHPLVDYISRLVHQTLVQVTGGLGFILTTILELALPGVIIKWVFYLILLVMGLLVGGYQVFVDMLKERRDEALKFQEEITSLQQRLHHLELKQPRIVVGWQDENQSLIQRLRLQLRPLPPKPPLDEMIKQKRDELLANKTKGRIATDSKLEITINLLFDPNPDYDKEVDEYLVEYRKYLMRRYDIAIINDRLLRIWPMVENRGTFPATSVTIELTMPPEFQLPSPFQKIDAYLVGEGEKYLPSPPDEPEMFKPIDFGQGLSLPSFLHPEDSRIEKRQSNTDGPEIIERNGVKTVSYRIEKLIQNRAETDFDALLMWAGDVEQTTVWRIPIKIFAAELQYPLEDAIELELVVSDEPE
jgi:hypothetical protein